MNAFRLNCGAWMAIVGALVVGGGNVARAEDATMKMEGRVIQISPADGQGAVLMISNAGDAAAESSDKSAAGAAGAEHATYWVGILGYPVSPELRAQLDIPAGQGLLVRQVVADSPAAKSGLKEYDILLRGNDKDLHEWSDLMELVRAVGPKKATITLEILRQGKRQAVDITPAERPARVAGATTEGGAASGWTYNPGDGQLKAFSQMLGAGGGSSGSVNDGQLFRFFGPGVVLGQSTDMSGMPSGVSVSIERKDNQPPHITVKRGDKTWEVTGDNLESLNQLPDDVRPFVAKMLSSAWAVNPATGGGGFSGMPQMPQMPNMPRMGNMADAEKRMQDRLDQMEQHLQELEERMHNASPGVNGPDAAK